MIRPISSRVLRLPASEHIYVCSRTAGKHGRRPEVLVLSTDGRTAHTLDLAKLDKAAVAALFKPKRQLIGYDIKSSLELLLEIGVQDLPPVGHDVLIGAFLLNSLRREQTLTGLAETDLDYDGSPFEDLDKDEFMARAPEFIAAIKALHTKQAAEIKTLDKLADLASRHRMAGHPHAGPHGAQRHRTQR